jgi:hypothetical protein
MILLVAVALAASGCGGYFGRDIEYEEQIYLDLDGSATVVVNASIAALVALRGLDLDPSPRARLDRNAVRAAYEAPGVRVLRVGRPWWRHGRRFVQVRLEVDDIRRLGADPPFAPVTFRFARSGDTIEYQENVGAPVGRPVGDVGWTGRELVAFRAHLPSRILYHNVRNVDDGSPGDIERGNILSWEQTLGDRLRGVPLHMDARIEAASILQTTLWLFVASTAAALLLLAVWIWWMIRRGRRANLMARPPAA